MHEGGAERVVMESPDTRVLIARTTQEMGPREIAAQYLSDAHFVVVEGFKKSDLPKIEVYRRAVHAQPLYSPDAPDAATYLAVVTDVADYRAPIPVHAVHRHQLALPGRRYRAPGRALRRRVPSRSPRCSSPAARPAGPCRGSRPKWPLSPPRWTARSRIPRSTARAGA